MLERAVDLALRAVDSGLLPGGLQKALWRRWYQTLNRHWQDGAWTFMNYGYVPGAGEPVRALAAEDEGHRLFIALYDQALAGIPVSGRRVLEVGTGRGGGASFIARYLEPASVTGLDNSSVGLAFCEKVHAGIGGLAFTLGDAEDMPFEAASFDVVVNVESSHCYADMGRFAAEVARVLAPGGHFAWADLRGRKMVASTAAAFDRPGLEPLASRDITANVFHALDEINDVKLALIDAAPLYKGFLRQFTGTRGSLIYQALAGGYAVYQSRTFRKAGTPA